jgi:hypothetical protein
MQKRTSPTVIASNVVRRTFGSSATARAADSNKMDGPPAHKVCFNFRGAETGR